MNAIISSQNVNPKASATIDSNNAKSSVFKRTSKPTQLKNSNNKVILSSADTAITINTKYDVTIDFTRNSFKKSLRINLIQVDTLKLIGNSKVELYLIGHGRSNKSTNCIFIERSKIQIIDLSQFRLKRLIAYKSSIDSLNLTNVCIDSSLNISKTRLYRTNFNFSDLPDTIDLHSVRLETLSKNIDWTRIKNNDDAHNFERTLKIGNTDLNKINLDYGRFNFHVDHNLELRNARWIYETIIFKCNESGLMSKVDWYSRELSEIEDETDKLSVTNLINYLWWNRGQRKTQAVLITFGVFLSFFLLNLRLFKRLKTVYMPKPFEEYFTRADRLKIIVTRRTILGQRKWTKRHWQIAHVSGVFFYSGLIFWGIRFNIDNFRMNSLPICFLLLFQHLVGLLFIANIIGFIIVKT